ncbi:hypothetical protein [Streptomyces coeruleorubidus]|uniref:hypothetical protein n=1 Tax=Streptomyces coeruleorubidus TaxID=116188 RepID=UPI0033A0397A
MKRPTRQSRESVAGVCAVLGAMGIAATLVCTGHATVAEASNFVSSGIVYLTAVSGVRRERDSLGR